MGLETFKRRIRTWLEVEAATPTPREPNSGTDAATAKATTPWWKFPQAQVLATLPFVFGLAALLCHGIPSGKLSTTLLCSLACLAGGGVIGFLFAIPRVSQGTTTGEGQSPPRSDVPARKNSPPGGQAGDVTAAGGTAVPDEARADMAYGLRVNTNLVEISDWLCKIIVGIGLFEMKTLAERLADLSGSVAADMGSPNDRSFAGALIIYFSVTGFLYGYLLTRIFLTGLIARADREAVLGAAKETARDTAKETVRDTTRLYADLLDAIAESRALVDQPAAPQARVDEIIRKLEEARRNFPDNRRAAVRLGWLYANRRGDPGGAILVLQNALIEMRRRGTETPKDRADILYNLACYRYRQLKQAAADPDKQQRQLQDTYQYLAESVKLSPPNAQEALREAEAGKDFAKLLNDPEFRRIVGAPPSPPAPHPPSAPLLPAPPQPAGVVPEQDPPENDAGQQNQG